MKLSEKGYERRSEHEFGRYIGAKTGRTVRCRCSVRLRFGCLQDFSDSFKGEVRRIHIPRTSVNRGLLVSAIGVEAPWRTDDDQMYQRPQVVPYLPRRRS